MDRPAAQPLRWTAILGFALGGFLDGILLHQVLQWPHLLSLWGEGRELTWHVLWDGLFHGLMYGLAALGLWGLCRHGLPGGRRFLGALLIGFGLWHVVDGVVFHWLLEVHHIRVDTAQPLLWDAGWLVVLGIGPLVAGWTFTRRAGRPANPRT
jgi:uncharacterized membrane protein